MRQQSEALSPSSTYHPTPRMLFRRRRNEPSEKATGGGFQVPSVQLLRMASSTSFIDTISSPNVSGLRSQAAIALRMTWSLRAWRISHRRSVSSSNDRASASGPFRFVKLHTAGTWSDPCAIHLFCARSPHTIQETSSSFACF